MAIEPYRFDREVRGRGGHRSGASHIRRACDCRDPAAVPRDVHDRRPPGDRAGVLPRAPDRDRRDWDPTVAAIFGEAFALPLWRLVPLLLLSVGFGLYLLLPVRY